MATTARHPTNPAHRAVVSGPREIARARRQVLPRAVIVLAVLVVALAAVAATAGLFWSGSGAPDTFVSVRGETVDLYGVGVYRFDSAFKGAANRGADAVTLVLAIPLLLMALARAVRGSFRARLLLSGALVWFLYVGVSLALGAAYNSLFLVYVALFSASLFGVVATVRAIDPGALAARMSPAPPRIVPGAFMLASGIVTFGIWLQPLVSAARSGEPPALLDGSTTMVTDTLDLGVIVPLAIASGVLILRRRPAGYILAFSLLVLEALLAPMIAMQTLFQLDAGVDLGTGEAIGAIVGFSAISLAAVGILLVLLRHISEPPGRATGL
jgi:hypothetical protein